MKPCVLFISGLHLPSECCNAHLQLTNPQSHLNHPHLLFTAWKHYWHSSLVVLQNMTCESQGSFQHEFHLTFVSFSTLSLLFSVSYLFVLLLPARSLNFPCKSCESCCLQSISFTKVTLSPRSLSLAVLFVKFPSFSLSLSLYIFINTYMFFCCLSSVTAALSHSHGSVVDYLGGTQSG